MDPSPSRMLRDPGGEPPGRPGFTLRVPEGWVVGDLPDALVAVGAPQPAGDAFRPNLTVNGEPVPAGLDPGQVADQIVDGLRGAHGEVAVVERHHAGSTCTQELRFTVEDQPLVQVQSVISVDGPEGHRTVFTVVGSCAEGQREVYGPILAGLIASFTPG